MQLMTAIVTAMSKYRQTITVITVIDRGSLLMPRVPDPASNLGNLKNSALIEIMVIN